MVKTNNNKLFLAFSLIVVLALILFSTRMFARQGDPFAEIHEKVAGITNEERESVKKLFVLVQEIEEMEREEAVISKSIEVTSTEIKELQRMINSEEKAYESKRETLKQVLISYQRQGPGSYLEIILDSKNLTTLIKRLNILREITHNTGELLDKLEESKELLASKKEQLSGKLETMEKDRRRLREALDSKSQLRKNLEVYIESLGEKREYYRDYLANLEHLWDDLKPLFAETTKEISKIVREENLPLDSLKFSFNLFGIKAAIDDKTFNEIIRGYPHIPRMEFRFYPGKTEIRMPDKNLILTGAFTIIEGHAIKFDPKAGSFYGFPLEASAIEALFSQGYLLLDLKSMMGDFIIHSIENQEGNLEFTIKPAL